MPMPIPLRADFDAPQLRQLARESADANQVRRLLALAAIDDGATRTEAAEIGGVTLQVIRDWVLKFNAGGPDGLINGKAPGQPSRLNEAHRAALAAVIESGPIPAVHGVVRWRIMDLCQWLWDEFRVSVSKQTLGRELRAMGYRKLSARPRHHAQAEGAIEEFKKNFPPLWTRSRAQRASMRATSRSGSAIRPASARRTRSPAAGPGVEPGPLHRTISAPPRPISSVPSARQRAKRPASSCPGATPRR
jgi:transposase